MNIIEANRELIESALAYSGGTHSYEDIEQGVLTGHMQIWPYNRSVAITEIVVYPRKKVLNVFLAAGDLEEVMAGIESVAAWGRTQGCTAMILSGRRGWERVLAPLGWTPTMSVMERSI